MGPLTRSLRTAASSKTLEGRGVKFTCKALTSWSRSNPGPIRVTAPIQIVPLALFQVGLGPMTADSYRKRLYISALRNLPVVHYAKPFIAAFFFSKNNQYISSMDKM